MIKAMADGIRDVISVTLPLTAEQAATHQ